MDPGSVHVGAGDFLQGGFHENYATTPLDKSGHSGAQIVQRYFVNQINKLV